MFKKFIMGNQLLIKKKE